MCVHLSGTQRLSCWCYLQNLSRRREEGMQMGQEQASLPCIALWPITAELSKRWGEIFPKKTTKRWMKSNVWWQPSNWLTDRQRDRHSQWSDTWPGIASVVPLSPVMILRLTIQVLWIPPLYWIPPETSWRQYIKHMVQKQVHQTHGLKLFSFWPKTVSLFYFHKNLQPGVF